MPNPPNFFAALPTPTVSLRGISVVFGSLTALDGVDLDLEPGRRYAVVGENGAGKSTLMKVLFGLLAPTRGEVRLDGQAVRFASPADAIRRGIGMVQQHFELVENFTVAENITLGAEVVGRGGVLNRQAAREAVTRLADESGLSVDPDARIEELSVASQQRVEILKALYRRARVLILDEPTAVLAPAEARDLWAATARLSQGGTTVVFITHKLDEVMAHADFVTVLRRGKRVLASAVSDTTAGALATAMVGEGALPAALRPAADPLLWTSGAGETLLQIKNVSVAGRRGETVVDGVSLDLRAGEIVSLAGVDGSGQVELIEAIMGLRPLRAGQITLAGQDISRLPVAARRAAGIGYVPEDRHHRAVVLPLSCEENIVLGRQREPVFAGAGGVLKRGFMRSFLKAEAGAFDVRGAGAGVPVRSLSGGNQQKLVMARELSRQPRVLLAAQPTRGLDFAASAFVHTALRGERNRGAAVLVQSLDLDEALALADRVAVMLRGRIVAVLDRHEATPTRVGALMTGAESGSA